uniref:chitinase n=1 Tax=Phallusia mammillata TaxID=59560 RepID=A0A6F9DID1_9ASCI|nr:uncharacterized protein LOC104265951 [Phallusia mammillata]
MDNSENMFVLVPFLFLLIWTTASIDATRSNRRVRHDITCNARRRGYFPDERDCTRYFLCLGGRKHVFKCVRGSTFVPSANRCIQNTTCAKARTVDSHEPSFQFCNDGYRRRGEMCYKIFPVFTTWENANIYCARDSAVLAQSTSQHILRFLKRLSRFFNTQDFWISTENMDSTIRNMTTLRGKGAIEDKDHRQMLDHLCIKLSHLHGYKPVRAVCQYQNGYICQKQFTSSATAPSGPRTPILQSSCVNGPQTQPIVGGRNAESSHHPWMVSLQKHHKHICGATLINRCWLLSAAHCLTVPFVLPKDMPTHAVFGWNAANTRLHLRILLGSIVLHPTFSAYPVPTNDIALVKLNQCTSKFRPMCPSSPELPVNNLQCYVLGFGATDPSGGGITNRQSLQILSMPLIDDATCQSSYLDRFNNNRTYITNTMFCAGYMEGGRDSCRGDSGGPLICMNRVTRRILQWGVVSWGGGCAIRNKPGVYAKVAAFHSWIQNTTRFV